MLFYIVSYAVFNMNNLCNHKHKLFILKQDSNFLEKHIFCLVYFSPCITYNIEI